MSNLGEVLRFKFPNAGLLDVGVLSHSTGEHIHLWNETALGRGKPTAEELAQWEAEYSVTEYRRKRAEEWASGPWNVAAQNSAIIKWYRGDASEMQALNKFDLSVRAKWPKPGA